MFNFVSKTLLLYGRRCTITSTNYNKDFASPIFIKCLSTATSNQHSFTVSYLINSCGLSQKTALSASKNVYLNSPENADSVIALLKTHGFSETQISNVIRVRPEVLGGSPERNYFPKFEFFYSKGFSSHELAKILSVCPNILCRSLENHLIPTFNYLIDLFQSSEKVIDAVKRTPYILVHDVENCLVPKLNVLRENGVSDSNLRMLLRNWSRIMGMRLDILRNTVEVVKDLGINPLSSHFVLAILLKGFSRNKWENKVNVYKRWGWSEEEILAEFCKNPLCMMASKEKITVVMDFLVNKMDVEPSAIAKYPGVIVLSLEKTKRFIPRAAVFQFMLSKGLINRKDTNLITLFMCPEKAFLRKFVNSYDDEAPQLLKLYQEKLDLLKMKKKKHPYQGRERWCHCKMMTL